MKTRKSNNPLKRWGSELNKEFSIEEYQMSKKHLKKCSTCLVIREVQIKTTSYQSEWLRSKTQVIVDAGEDVEKEKYSSISGGILSWYRHSGNLSGAFSENWT